MGGGLSLTFPGYHIFVSYMMLITELIIWLIPWLFLFFFLLSKKYKGNFSLFPPFFRHVAFNSNSLNQGFLFGLYFDYHRFLYFVLLPVIMLIALGIDHTSRFFSRIIDTHLFITKGNSPIKNGGNKIVLRLMPHLNCKFTSSQLLHSLRFQRLLLCFCRKVRQLLRRLLFSLQRHLS
jgi:hypothetical protein